MKLKRLREKFTLWIIRGDSGALEGIRTPNLLIRSQMLYPLSYKRRRAGEYYPLIKVAPNVIDQGLKLL